MELSSVLRKFRYMNDHVQIVETSFDLHHWNKKLNLSRLIITSALTLTTMGVYLELFVLDLLLVSVPVSSEPSS